MSTKPGYRARLPSTFFQGLRNTCASEHYIPITLREIQRYRPAKDYDLPNFLRKSINLAIQENRAKLAKAIAQYYCYMPTDSIKTAIEFGNLEILEWVKGMRKDLDVGCLGYLHTDVMDWLYENGYLRSNSGRLAASTSAEGRAWCLRNGFADDYIESTAIAFALETGVYDEEYLLSRSGGRFALSSITGLIITSAGAILANYPRWKEVMPRVVRHVGYNNKADLMKAVTAELTSRSYYGMGSIDLLFSNVTLKDG